MKNPLSIFLFILVVFLGFNFNVESIADAAQASQWNMYESNKDGFSILMPKVPNVSEIPIKEHTGPRGSSGPGLIRMFISEVGSPLWEEKAFSISRVSFVKEVFLDQDSEKILNLQKEGILSKISKVQLISEKQITYGEFKGKEISFTGEKSGSYTFFGMFRFHKKSKTWSTARIWLVDNQTCYLIQTFYSSPVKSFSKMDYTEAHRFLDSFQLK